MASPKFTVVEEPDVPTPESSGASERAADFLLLLLKPLSQKTIIALGNLFSLLTVISVFWLAMTVVPHTPTIEQLVGLGGYAVFVIVVNWIVRRK